jgi:hypothetical protein
MWMLDTTLWECDCVDEYLSADNCGACGIVDLGDISFLCYT